MYGFLFPLPYTKGLRYYVFNSSHNSFALEKYGTQFFIVKFCEETLKNPLFRKYFLEKLQPILEKTDITPVDNDFRDFVAYHEVYFFIGRAAETYDICLYGSALLNSIYQAKLEHYPEIRYIPSIEANQITLEEAQKHLYFTMYNNVRHGWGIERIRKKHPTYLDLRDVIMEQITFQIRVATIESFEKIEKVSMGSEGIKLLLELHPTFRFLRRMRGAFVHNYIVDAPLHLVPKKYRSLKKPNENGEQFKERYNIEYYKNLFWRNRQILRLNNPAKPLKPIIIREGDGLNTSFFGPIEAYAIKYDIMDQLLHFIKNYPDKSEFLFHVNDVSPLAVEKAKDYEFKL